VKMERKGKEIMFTRQLRRSGTELLVSVPTRLRRGYGLKAGDFVRVVLKVILTVEEQEGGGVK